MTSTRFSALLAGAAMLASCGGGDGGGGSSGGATAGTPTPTPTTASSGCALRARQDWAFATLNKYYLFYDTLPASLDPTPFADVETYIDALTATARAQHKDRYFTYLTSVAEENAYYSSGSSAGIGVRLAFDASNRLFITEAFEGAPALAAGIDRGAEILAIGTSDSNLKTVASLISSGNTDALNAALGPSTAGDTRVYQIRDAAGTRNLTVAKADYELQPVSSRYGGKIIDDGGERIGYVNLRTFIDPANDGLRSAFASFKAAGVTKVIVDLRYNGGGLVNVAELFTNLLGGNRSTSDVQAYITFRPSLAATNNDVTNFTPQPQSVATTKVAFIGSGGTASASEYVINAMVPYLHANAALIGSNTYGKPVGQIAVDNPDCSDDRLRVIAFALENADHYGGYYNGLAANMNAQAKTCAASDDLSHQLGDASEGSTRAALDFLEGKACTPISASAAARTTGEGAGNLGAPERTLLTPRRATTMQRETPGSF